MMGSVGSYDVCVWWGKPCLILLDIIFCPLMRSPWETPLLLPVRPDMRPYPEGPVQELQGHPPSEGRAGRNSSWSLWSSVVSYAPSSMTLNFSSALCLCVSSFLFFFHCHPVFWFQLPCLIIQFSVPLLKCKHGVATIQWVSRYKVSRRGQSHHLRGMWARLLLLPWQSSSQCWLSDLLPLSWDWLCWSSSNWNWRPAHWF